MTLLSVADDRYVFRLGRRERKLLVQVLRQYPLVPAGYHRFTRAGVSADDADNQQLLEESLAAHRGEARARLDRWLRAAGRFTPAGGGYRLALNREEMEWLLQVLNDVRVGNWIKAGCPEFDPKTGPEITPANETCFFNLTVVDHFQGALLDAL